MHVGHPNKQQGIQNRTTGARGLWLVACVVLLVIGHWSLAPGVFAQTPSTPLWDQVISLGVSPVDGRNVIVGTLNVPSPAGIYRSLDGGYIWSQVDAPLPPNTAVAAIRYDPQNPKRVLAADGGVGNLFISEDGGLNWRQEPSIHQVLSPNSGVGRFFTRIENGQTVYYAGTRFDGVVRSLNGGTSWEEFSNGLIGGALRVRSFVEKDGILYAGTHNGLWRLPIDSTTWEPVSLPGNVIVRGLTILQGRLYAGTFASGIYLSDDGDNWVQDLNFPTGLSIYDLTTASYQVIAGTSDGMWTQNRQEWIQATVNDEIYSNPVYRLRSSSTLEGVAYAGTAQDWVLRTIDGGTTFQSIEQLTPLDPAQVPGPPTPTPTLTPIPTATPIPTDTPLPTPTPTLTPIPTVTPIPTDTPLPTATPIPTDTPIPTATPLPPPPQEPNILVATDIPPVPPPDTPIPTDTPLPLPTAKDTPVVPPTPTPTPSPAEVVAENFGQLPPIWVGGAAAVFLLVLLGGLSVARGPREI